MDDAEQLPSPVALVMCVYVRQREVKKDDVTLHLSILLKYLTYSLFLLSLSCRSSSQVLQVLCVLSSSDELPWRDGARVLSLEEVLLHLLTLAQNSAHRSVKRTTVYKRWT